MTHIPNARIGENGYKDTDLKGADKHYLDGYDAAIDDILGFWDNLEIYSGESLNCHALLERPEIAEDLKERMADYAEMQRNECAVSLLDNQYVEEADEQFDNEQ